MNGLYTIHISLLYTCTYSHKRFYHITNKDASVLCVKFLFVSTIFNDGAYLSLRKTCVKHTTVTREYRSISVWKFLEVFHLSRLTKLLLFDSVLYTIALV